MRLLHLENIIFCECMDIIWLRENFFYCKPGLTVGRRFLLLAGGILYIYVYISCLYSLFAYLVASGQIVSPHGAYCGV